MARTEGGGLPCFPSSMKHVKTMTLSYGLGAVEIRLFTWLFPWKQIAWPIKSNNISRDNKSKLCWPTYTIQVYFGFQLTNRSFKKAE